MKYYLYNILFIFIIISFNCQSENTNYYDNLKFSHFTEKDGLNSSTLDQIYQDSIGYIWVATNRALLRYNGEKFQNLTEKGNKFFKENTYNIKSITNKNSFYYFLKSDNLIILDIKKNSYSSFDNKHFFNKDTNKNYLQNCYVDNNNNVWIMSSKGLYKSKRKDGKIIDFIRIVLDKKWPSLAVFSICQDNYNNFWIGTKKGLFVFNEKNNKTIYLSELNILINNSKINIVRQDKKGMVWVGQNQQLLKFNANIDIFKTKNVNCKNYSLNETDRSNQIKDFQFDLKGNIWVLMQFSIRIVEFKGDSYDIHLLENRTDKKNSLSSNNFRSLLINDKGLIFIGTRTSGINICNIDEKDITTLTPRNYYKTFDIRSTYKDYTGNLWIALSDGKIFYYVVKSNKFIEIKTNSHFLIGNIFETKNHEIFFSSNSKEGNKGGLVKINNTETFYKTLNPKILNFTILNFSKNKDFFSRMSKVIFAYQDIDETFWVAVVDEGFYHLKYNNNKISVIKHFTKKYFEKLGLNLLYNINFSLLRDSSLYISSMSNYMLRYNRQDDLFEKVFDINTYDKKIKNNEFTFAFLDKNGIYWFGTKTSGLIKYNKKTNKARFFNEDNSQLSNVVSVSIMDKDQNMWLGTKQGISVIDSLNQIHNVVKDEGLIENLQKYTYLELDKNHYCFGGKGGLYLVNNKLNLDTENDKDKLAINNIKVNGVSLYKDFIDPSFYNYIKEIKISSSEKNITIKVNNLSYYNSSIKKYSYRLLPIQKKWKIEKNGNNYINLNNLKQGLYTLQIKAINSNGNSSTIIKSINISINKPYYKTWWFISLAIVLIFLIITVIYLKINGAMVKSNIKLQKKVNEQTKKLLENNKELTSINTTRTKMFSVIAHDLIGPLGNVMTSTTMMDEDYEELLKGGLIHKFISSNKDSLTSLYELLQNLLFWSRGQKSEISMNPISFNLYDLCIDVSNFLKSILKKKGNVFVISMSKDLNIFADKQMVHTIIRNIISNSNKFTENGTIRIEATETDEFIKISIEDTGIGMSNNRAKNLFNESNVKSTDGTAGEKGTGLGLAVSKDFVIKHGGEIYAQSNEGKGTVIFFSLKKNI